MAQKNNIRSIRFSDELAKLIDQQVGDTFTQKFENLITKCVWELPRKEEELRRVQEKIKKERQKLYNFQRATAILRDLERSIQIAQSSFRVVERQAQAIADAVEKQGL